MKIMPGIFKNENLMAENNARILKWFVWLQNFDYEIVYKPGYLDCLADMLIRECTDSLPCLNMFQVGSSSKSKKPKLLMMFEENDRTEKIAKQLFST